MKVYYAGNNQGDHTVIVAPANDPLAIKAGSVEAWKHPDGTAKNIRIQFKGGVAEVEDAMGKYLCASGIGKPTKLIGYLQG